MCCSHEFNYNKKSVV
jgi:hypothetical protein